MKYKFKREHTGSVSIHQFDRGICRGRALIKVHPNVIYLEHIEIFGKYRRRGYGSKLLNYVREKYGKPIKGNWKNKESREFFRKNNAIFLAGRSFRIG